MIKAAANLLYETAVSDGDAMMLYYETGNDRFVAGCGDIDKYIEMFNYIADEVLNVERGNDEVAH